MQEVLRSTISYQLDRYSVSQQVGEDDGGEDDGEASAGSDGEPFVVPIQERSLTGGQLIGEARSGQDHDNDCQYLRNTKAHIFFSTHEPAE